MYEFASLLMLVAVLAALIVMWFRGRGPGREPAVPERGSLLLTGVSPRPDADGAQYVTISGTLSGPTVPGEVVYGRFAWDTKQWPSVGSTVEVVYPSGKPQHWQIADPGARPHFGT